MRTLALIALGGLGAACGTKALPLDFSADWPSDPPSLEVATKTWTRHARELAGLDADVELIIEVDATFRSPQWRAAYVEHMRKQGKLSKSDTDTLRAEQQKAAAESNEFILLVKTHDRRINDLAKGERASWQLRLRDASGAEAAPIKVFKDRRPPGEISAEVPHLDAFHEIYIAQFPAELALLGGDKFAMKIFGARGGLEIEWKRGQ